jgi:hypothetical protein
MEYRLIATVSIGEEVAASAEVVLLPLVSSLRVSLAGANGQWPVTEDLTIEAVVVDPEEGERDNDGEVLRYRWECSQEGAVCLTAGGDLLLPTIDDASQTRQSAALNIPAGSLAPGGLYTLTLTAFMADR